MFAACGSDELPPKPSVVMPSALSAVCDEICTRAAGRTRNGSDDRSSIAPYTRISLITLLPKCEVSDTMMPPP